MRAVLSGALDQAEALIRGFRSDSACMKALEDSASLVLETFLDGGKVLACGNGGSMADAMHFCEEWTGRFRKDRKPYPAIALADPTHISCVANDYGYDQVFSRQVEALAQPGDLLLALSTSGASKNLVSAAQAARMRRAKVIGFLGRGGGALLAMCDVAMLAPGETADRIQELHMLCLHALVEAVEGELARQG